MRIGILSDTHLDVPDLQLAAVLRSTLGEAQLLLHAGDHTADGVIDYLESEEPRPYLGVAGNMDLGRDGRRLPPQRVFEVEGYRIGLVHGWGSGSGLEQRVLRVFEPAVDILVFGHSHRPMVRRIGPTLLINPGSAFVPRNSATGTVALLQLLDGGPKVEFFDVVP